MDPEVIIVPLAGTRIADEELENLLREVYVAGGFTDPSLAGTMLRAADVKARGEVTVALNGAGRLIGSVITVLGGSAACRFAGAGESELHLLSVHPASRRRGLGSALVEAAIAVARGTGSHRMILWTQPAMAAARALYLKHGFTRVPSMDFSRGEREFQVFARPL